VPVRPALPATVVITQARHPLEGRELRVLGWMRRLGRLELMLELPDGSKRLIPAEQTSQHDDPDPGPGSPVAAAASSDSARAPALNPRASSAASTSSDGAPPCQAAAQRASVVAARTDEPGERVASSAGRGADDMAATLRHLTPTAP